MDETPAHEWMTASQSKERFGIGFSLLMMLADRGLIDRRELPADLNGDVTFLFRCDDVRNYIEGANK